MDQPPPASGATGEMSWAQRAEAAETAVLTRHLRPLWWTPGTQLGLIGWPASTADRWFVRWHYWWQAHLLDTLVDAYARDPHPQRRTRIARQARTHRLRNLGRWTNSYYDDMAWLALALHRAGTVADVARPRALDTLTGQLMAAWVPEDGGGIPWRKADQFFNAPANGPAGIVLARRGELRRAQQMADWIDTTLVDPDTALVFDGIKGGSLSRAQYTYCQGVVLGLETELAVRTTDARHAARVHRLVAATAEHMTVGGVIGGGGGGDGGLFPGVLARYLALVATDLPGTAEADSRARALARDIVLASAEAAWRNRRVVAAADGVELPLFGNDWTAPAKLPAAGDAAGAVAGGAVGSSTVPERDLSVQLSGWMLMEAAHTVSAR